MQIYIILLNTALLVGLWYLIFIAWRNYRLELTRQEIFKLRDNLFLYARDGGLPFDAEAYVIMRTILNGTIRFGHKISFIRLVAPIVVERCYTEGEVSKNFDAVFNHALEQVSPEARRKILSTRDRLHRIILEHMVFSSIMLTLLYVIAWALPISGKIGRKVLFGDSKWSAFDAEAEAYGRNGAYAK